MRISEPIPSLVARLLVIADRVRIADILERRYPGVDISCVPSFMSGIAELKNGPIHAVVAHVDPGFGSVEKAVRGLRTAVGETVPVILCCEPQAEPIARRAVDAGANDYVIFPPEPAELDALLSLKPKDEVSFAPAPGTNDQEMIALSEILEHMASAPHRVLQKMTELLAVALNTPAAMISAEGASTRVGASQEYVLQELIPDADGVLGEVAIGPPHAGSYGRAEIDKLRYYCELFGHILRAARRQQQWQQLALTDDLTKLPNRRYVLNFLDRTLQRAARERFRVTVCMFDIDDFKVYNDEFGHDVGDEILRATGQLLMRHCRVEDVVARFGGDEFVVVFWDAESPRVSGSQHPDEAIQVMKRFQAALLEHEFGCLGPKAKGALTISGGLASYPWDAANSSDLISRADEALLMAKRLGKNTIQLIGGNS